MATSMVILK